MISDKNKHGDCYEVHGRFMMNNGSSGKYTLVHAAVLGQGALDGVEYGHAFIIDNDRDVVIDMSNGRTVELPKNVYYILGKIEDERGWTDAGGPFERTPQVYEYDFKQAMKMMSDYGHWGPWELDTEY